ncbi:MAG: rhodanese-like domain-containing protein [Magnetococcales bacterium]|nr:rhodanese-like domain-containing protein [Magnetococcales bacterium]
MRIKSVWMAIAALLITGISWESWAFSTNITDNIGSFTVKHGSKTVEVKRQADPNATLHSAFAKTGRRCPPYCAQPMEVAPGVKTIGEVELVAFMLTHLQDGTGLLVDARSPNWHARGTIPGSVNVPYIDINLSMGADPITIADNLELFGAVQTDHGWDFSSANSLAVWCNGPWCGQSPAAIRGLLELGYPTEKIFYYRGGMQMWQIFGLTVTQPEY